MHRTFVAWIAFQPHFLHRECQDRGQPCCQAVEQNIQNRPCRAAFWRITVAIQHIFANVEVEGRQIHCRKGKDRLKHALEIIGVEAITHLGIQFRQTVQNPLFQFRHIRRCCFIRVRIIRQGSQHKPHRVAQAAIAVCHTFQDFWSNAQISGVIRLGHP